MTIEEAINWYETKLIVNETVGLTGNQHEAAKLALAALREQRERMNNHVLTLEELREMDGEPVWVVTGSAFNAGRGCWDICDWWDKDTVMFPYSGEQPRIDECGITWTAYRRKPEEGTA